MVGTEQDEARRLELAKLALELPNLQAEFARLQSEEKERREREKKRHKAELEKVDGFRRSVVNPVGTRYRSASSAMSELRAQFIERPIISAEGGARAAVSRITRTVEKQKGAIKRARDRIRINKENIKGTQMERDLKRADLELALELDSLKAAQEEWVAAREILDAAIARALGGAV